MEVWNSFRHARFDILIRHSSGDSKQVVGYMSVQLHVKVKIIT